jgi:hypothetical protein
MQSKGKFILMNKQEFKDWLMKTKFTREIKHIQEHHTYIPNYKTIIGQDHFKTLEGMERTQIDRGFETIGQNITTFNDGTIAICRDFNIAPAGIKGFNTASLCIENVGNFDIGGDTMTELHKDLILYVTALLCIKFKITPSTDDLVYHHWFDLVSGERIDDNSKGHSTKTCPGTNWFGGNTIEASQKNFIPSVAKMINDINKPVTPIIPVVSPTPQPKPTPLPEPLPKNFKQLSKGDKSTEVKILQQKLIKLGFKLSPDGDYGTSTESCVKTFQHNNKLTQDGVVGVITYTLINKLVAGK